MAEFNPLAPVVALLVEYALWGIAVAIGFVAHPALLLPRLQGKAGEAKEGKALGRLFGEVLHDIIVPDGRGGLTQIDHVALTREGLLLVETKHYRGAVFGRERDARWTQRLGGRSYRFQNPLRQNFLHVSALRSLGLGVPVQGLVLFTDDATFPKGLPKGVSRLRDLKRDLGSLKSDDMTSLAHAAAWERLAQSARTDSSARKAHREALWERKGRDSRPLVAGFLLAASVLWLVILGLRSGL